MRTALLVAVSAMAALPLGCSSSDAHISWSGCSLIEGKSDGLAECATVSLPLDDSQAVPGTIGISFNGRTRPSSSSRTKGTEPRDSHRQTCN